MRTDTPEHYLDPPDDPPDDSEEVLRLKEDVRALRDLLSDAAWRMAELNQWAKRAYVSTPLLDRIEKLQDRIDEELNG